ncbi:LOB domain-containing protein 27-like isoform X1 [Arachis hypogaea]|uniref:LOB domain-containing protein 27-like isoform X1 n=1 Tax=Arachis hypogaea TaxID=3818 RepID=UPI003B21A86E|nr:LOB domain-containing protein [Arachis hypogaea]
MSWPSEIKSNINNKGGANKACAACKFQRRRCTKDCILSPYFPSDKPTTFTNAHRLFGVCNMTRILSKIKPEQRDECMKSIIFESDMRAQFPVEGCLGIIRRYKDDLAKVNAELHYVQRWIAYFKQQEQYHLQQQQQQQQYLSLPLILTPDQPYNQRKDDCTNIVALPGIGVGVGVNDNNVQKENSNEKLDSKLGALSMCEQFVDLKPSKDKLGECSAYSCQQVENQVHANQMDLESDRRLLKFSPQNNTIDYKHKDGEYCVSKMNNTKNDHDVKLARYSAISIHATNNNIQNCCAKKSLTDV